MTTLKASESSIWVQPDGLNTAPQYLGCHSIGDVAVPGRDKTLTWCPDPAKTGEFKVSGSIKGEPGIPTASIETPLTSVADYLEALSKAGCPFPLYLNKVSCGRRDLITNFDRAFIFREVTVSTRNLTGLAVRGPADDAESIQSFDFQFEELIDLFKLASTIANPHDIPIYGRYRLDGICRSCCWWR